MNTPGPDEKPSTQQPIHSSGEADFPDDLLGPSGASASRPALLGARRGPSLDELQSAGAGMAGGVGAWGLGRLRAALSGTGVESLADRIVPGLLPPSPGPGAEAARGGAEQMSQWASSARTSVLDDFASITAAARGGVHAALSHPVVASLGASTIVPAPLAEWAHIDAASRAGVAPPSEPTEEEQASLAYDPQRVHLAQWASRLAAAADQARQETVTPPRRKSEASPPGWVLPWPRSLHPVPISLGEWKSWFSDQGHLILGQISSADGHSNGPKADPVMSDMACQIAHAVRGQVFSRGVAAEARPAIWPFILGVYPWDSSSSQRHAILNMLQREYEALEERADVLLQGPTDASQPPSSRGSFEHVSAPQPSSLGPSKITYPTLRHADGAAVELKGTTALDQDLDLDLADEQRKIRLDCDRTDREHELFRLPPETGSAGSDAEMNSGWSETSNAHIRALCSILTALVLWDTQASSLEQERPSVPPAKLGGYAQGLSDLCAVLYVSLSPTADAREASPQVIALTFGCLRALLVNFGWGAAFRRDQVAMTSALATLRGMLRTTAPETYAHLARTKADNLFFTYRWLLVTFKRELALEDTCRVWESIWAADSELVAAVSIANGNQTGAVRQAGPGTAVSFSLVVAYALIVRETLALAQLRLFDETLHYFNSMAPAPRTASLPAAAPKSVEQHTIRPANDVLFRASQAARSTPGLWPPPPLPPMQ